jgi:Ku70/Ku80 beta-barrel domain
MSRLLTNSYPQHRLFGPPLKHLFEAIEVESTRTIEIDEFVPRSEIDDRYIDSPYYIAPDGQVGQDAFRQNEHGRARSGGTDPEGARHRT